VKVESFIGGYTRQADGEPQFSVFRERQVLKFEKGPAASIVVDTERQLHFGQSLASGSIVQFD